MKKIFIDPGHGGSDPGATANGLQEKDLCLKLALKLECSLKKKYTGHQVKLSRRMDQTLSLKERTDKANRWGADYLVSIHINAGGGRGFESYIYNGNYPNKTKTNHFRTIIHDEIIGATRFRDRGKKEANFYLLRESQMPAILTENGFIDSASDANQLKDHNYLQKIAYAHARGIAKALGLKTRQSDSTNYSRSKYNKKLNCTYHQVKRGDTLWSLAKRYHTTVDQLIKWNHPIVPERLQIGQRLIVSEEGKEILFHIIQRGDTLWQLAITYETTIAQLRKLNDEIDPKRLQIGHRLRIK